MKPIPDPHARDEREAARLPRLGGGAQKPRAVIDAIVDVYETSYATVHRAVYTLGEEATERYEGARKKVAELLNAAPARGDLRPQRHRGR